MKKTLTVTLSVFLLFFFLRAYSQAPTITSFSPTVGAVGTLVTIKGSNLNNLTSFSIGGVNAITVSNNGSQLVGMVMPGAKNGNVSISNSTSNANSSTLFVVTPTAFPSIQQGSKLIGNDVVGTPDQGTSVAISADGNTAIVGGAFDNNGIGGAAWVYVRKNNGWAQQGQKLIGDGGISPSGEGVAVAISADGNTVVIGGNNANSPTIGGVWVFVRNNGVWTQQGSKLIATSIGTTYQGSSVAISADGNTIVEGGATDNGSGAAWIFMRVNGVWNQDGNELTFGTTIQPLFHISSSVSISADGATVLVGYTVDNSGFGAAWIFTRSNGNWTQQGPKLLASAGSGYALFGSSVALSADGKTSVIGGSNEGDLGGGEAAGAIWVFKEQNGIWNLDGDRLFNDSLYFNINNESAHQGASVAISADGNTIIEGGYAYDGSIGAFWTFVRTNKGWVQQGSKHVANDAIGAANLGNSVSINATGDFAIVGGYRDNNDQGAAWIFKSTIDAGNQILATGQSAIQYNSHQLTAAEPIQLGTGSYEYAQSDFRVHTVNDSLNFTRFYNSLNNSINSPLGYGWSHSYNFAVNIQKDSASNSDILWSISYPDGHIASFIPFNDSTGRSSPLYIGTQDSLKKDSSGTFTLFTKDNHQYHFTSDGVLDHISDPNGNITQLNYTGGNLVSVVGQGGRTITFAYTGNNISSVSDPLNRTCSFTYDQNGNLQSATDANGGQTTFTYDANHRMVSVTDPLNNTFVKNSYDTTGRVIIQQDANTQMTKIAYDTLAVGTAIVTNPDNSQYTVHHDSAYRKTYIKDALGFTKLYTYDAYNNENGFTNENGQIENRQFDKLGNLLTRTQPDNIVTQISYNYFNSPLQVTDPVGNNTTFNYDQNDNLTSIYYPDNTKQYYTYNSNGLKQTYKDGNGNVTTYGYSINGDLTSVTSPTGTKSFAYDAAGRLVSTTDENGNTSKIAYDNNDNIISTTDALNHATTYSYDANNHLVSITDKNGSTTSIAYDKKGRMISKTDANSGVTKYSYDVMDNLVSVTDPNNNIVTYAYDTKGRKTSVTNALGTSKNQYDGVGNILEIIDATNNSTTYTYTDNNKTKTVQDGLNNTTTYAYDANENLITVTDPLSKITTYGYDQMNRLISVIDANKNSTSIIYDQNGNRKTISDASGHIQTYKYDASNRLITYLDAASDSYSYTYDAVGNTTQITKPTGTITKNYDALNRPTSIATSTGNTYSFKYDNNGNTLSLTCSSGTGYFQYDKLNRLTQYTDPFNKVVVYTYDAAGNKTAIKYPGNKVVSYVFDNANNIKKVTDWLNKSFSYSYDAAGRATQLLYPNGIHCDYTYDAAGRLTVKKSQVGTANIIASSTFTLDPEGNRTSEQKQGIIPANLKPLSKVFTYSNDDKLLKDSIWVYSNDNDGNRISQTKGQIKATYTFTVDNLLSKAVDTTGIISSFSYDATGRRLTKTSGSNTSNYVLDISGTLSQILQITDASGTIKSQYVYGNGLLERVDSAGNSLYYHFDGQHNTIALSDGNGNITDSYSYDPFGVMLVHNGTTNQPFTFLGEYNVEEENSSLYFARARYYDASNGRFLSKDSYPFSTLNPQTIDRYVYATNNPLIQFDYTGLYQNMDNSVGNNSNFDYSGLLQNQDNGAQNNNNTLWQYVRQNITTTDVGGISNDIGGVLSTFGGNPALNSLNGAIGNFYTAVDAFKLTKSIYSFAKNSFNNTVTGSQWVSTLETVAVTGGGIVLIGASAPVALGGGILLAGADLLFHYEWQKNNWGTTLNRLWQ